MERQLTNYATEGTIVAGQRQTIREQLEERKRAADEHLQDVIKALEFLDKNPDFEVFHNLLRKTGF